MKYIKPISDESVAEEWSTLYKEIDYLGWMSTGDLKLNNGVEILPAVDIHSYVTATPEQVAALAIQAEWPISDMLLNMVVFRKIVYSIYLDFGGGPQDKVQPHLYYDSHRIPMHKDEHYAHLVKAIDKYHPGKISISLVATGDKCDVFSVAFILSFLKTVEMV